MTPKPFGLLFMVSLPEKSGPFSSVESLGSSLKLILEDSLFCPLVRQATPHYACASIRTRIERAVISSSFLEASAY